MAWAEKLPSGRYRGGYRDRHGKLRYLPETYSQPAEAKRQASLKEDEVRRRASYRHRAGKITWREWAATWWPTRKVEASTLQPDTYRRDKHLLPRWGDIPLEDIERDHVQEWVNELEAGGLAPSTVAKCYSLLSASLKAAVIAGRLPANPCVSIALPTIPPGDEHYLERDEYAALREAMPDRRWKLLCDLLVGTGMRWGEAVAVHRRRIHKGQGRLDVVEAYDAARKEIRAYPKSKKKRGVPLTSMLLTTLQEWMDETAEQCATPHAKGSDCLGALLIPGPDGRVLDYFHFEKYVWRPAVRAAGIGHTTIHDLRHTYASWLIQDGVPLDQIQNLLGHASPQTTQRYAHLVDTQWDAVRAALGDTPQAGQRTVSAEAAPDLLHDTNESEGGKVIRIDRWRRPAG